MEKIIKGDKIKEIRFDETSGAELIIKLNSGVVIKIVPRYHNDWSDHPYLKSEVETKNIWDSEE